VQSHAILPSLLILSFALACDTPVTKLPSNVAPQYNRETGRLTSVEIDRDKDGKFEARAFMDGTRLQRIEIDENTDGKPERWEHYGPATSGTGSVILRAEDASETTGKVVRREYYESGILVRVEEDVDEDGRTDKWEKYLNGRLASVELDLSGSGKPERRLLYRSDGSVTAESVSASAAPPKG
jgi:hypothetical protein